MSQTSYSINQSAAMAGMLYDSAVAVDVVSAVDVTESAGVGYGLALARSSVDGQVKLPASSGDVAAILGVSVLSQTKEQALLTGVVNNPKGSDISVLRKGRIWVQVEEAVTQASPVFVRFASGSFTQLGAFRASADSASAAQLVGAVYVNSASAGGFAAVDLNLSS
jgi:hypothetical protein